MKFLEWFIKDETQKKWAELGGYTCSAAVLESSRIPERHAVQQGLLRDHVQGEGLLGAAGICRTADELNQRVYPYVVGGEGTATGDASTTLAADWNATFKKYGRGR
jgi:multiple sugar transport system substrate-binding protein